MAPPIKWQKTIGGNMSDALYSIRKAPGGYILGGQSVSNISGDKNENSQGGADFWVLKIDSAGNILLQNTIGGLGTDQQALVRPTSDGGYIIGGQSDSDISGDKTENSNGYLDYWIVKTDSMLNIQWQNTIGGNGLDYLMDINQTSDHGFIMGGYSDSNISGDKTENALGGQADYWVVKTDSIGNVQWDNTIGGNGWEYFGNVIQTSDGGYMISGRSDSDSSSDKSENSIGTTDYWIVKLDQGGTIQWENTIGSTGQENTPSITETFDGGYILSGSSSSNASGDKTENGRGGHDYWVVKIDSTGMIQWQKTVGGNQEDAPSSVIQTSDSGYVVAGMSSSQRSGDKLENSMGSRDYFILKFDNTGNLIWQNTIGGLGEDWAFDIQQINGGYIAAGRSWSDISGDKSQNNVGWFDYWIICLTDSFNTVKGQMFIDLNSNGIYDAGGNDLLITSKKVSETTGQFAFTDQFGHYDLPVVNAGTTVIPSAINYYSPIPASYSVNFSGWHQVDSLKDFAFQPNGTYNDLSITISPVTRFRPGFNATYDINCINTGTTTLNPIIIFFPDTGLTFVTATPAASFISNDSLTWILPPMSPFQSANISVTLHVDSQLVIGSILNSPVRVEPIAADADSSNNYSEFDVTVNGSWDPNAVVSNRNFILQPDLVNPPYIEYVIYFQNSGSDTAFFVRVLNPIDTNKLDISSLEFQSSSHPVNLYFNSLERNLDFTFNNILLPDSIIDEPGSHGYIRYRIKPKSNLVAGDSIFNFANIFFDFNSPVMTNVNSIPILMQVSVQQPEKGNSFLLYPNPVNEILQISLAGIDDIAEICVYDLFGKCVVRKKVNVNNKFLNAKINVVDLPDGMYVLVVANNKNKWQSLFTKTN